MERLGILFVVLGLCGCALAVHRDSGDWVLEKVRRCGTVIGQCGSEVW